MTPVMKKRIKDLIRIRLSLDRLLKGMRSHKDVYGQEISDCEWADIQLENVERSLKRLSRKTGV